MSKNSVGVINTRISKVNNPITPLPNQIEIITTKLRTAIDNLAKNFTDTKCLIIELARQLDETRQLEQGKICRKIKDILKDKIIDGKITGKWIEECLPQEYKRKYTKSEQTSLSGNNKKLEKIVVHNDGQSLLESSYNDSNIDNNTHIHRAQGSDTNQILQKERYHELEGALRKTSAMTSAQYLSAAEIKFTIPRERYEDVKTAMDRSSNCCYLFFDAYTGMLLRSESD